MMMPPKKSKAARELENGSPEKKMNGEAEGEDKPNVDIFKVEILSQKRERTVPQHETVFMTWINENFEDKEGVKILMPEIYEHYINMCFLKGCNAVEEYRFMRVVKETFPAGFTVKQSSVLSGELKERKIPQKKPKVEGETMKLKMKDIVREQLESMGNPKTGVRFNTLMKRIAEKYPALRLDLNSSPLMTYLNNGLRYGQVYATKGVGKSGFYRLWKDDETDEEEEEDKKAKDEKDGEKGEGEESTGDEQKESAEEGGEKSGEDGEKKAVKRKKAKSHKKKSKPARKIVHSAPQRIRDCFPLAMTYMNEPKIASARRIKQYLADYYDFNNEARLKKTLEDGTEKGWWNLVAGAGMGGSYELLVQEFDPTDDDDTVGKIINALTACSSPKQCSGNLLKSYIVEYHPEFKVTERPKQFKRALESALNDDEIRQITGLGMCGSFQLVESFIPGPQILAGKDTASDYEEMTSDEDGDDVVEYDQKGFDVTYFDTSNYVPRPSKRRGKARKIAPIEKLTYEPTVGGKRKRKMAAKRVARGGGKRGKYEEGSSEEEEEESEEEQEESEQEDSDNEYSKSTEKYKPRPSSSRGGGGAKGRGRPAASPAKKAQPAAKGRGRPSKAAPAVATPAAKGGKGRGRPAKGGKGVKKEEPEPAPAPSKGRGRPKKRGRR